MTGKLEIGNIPVWFLLNGELGIPTNYGKNDEEANNWIMSHIFCNILNRYERIIVISNNIDDFVLILHYKSLFFDKDINELWLKFGTGFYTQTLANHIVHSNIEHETWSVIFRLHILRGYDVTSKIRRKYGTLNVKPYII